MSSFRDVYLLIALLCILCLCGKSFCLSPYGFSTQTYTQTENLPQFKTGVQAILPDYRFHCTGVVTEINLHFAHGQDISRVVIQIWRPASKGRYEIVWGEKYPTPAVFERVRKTNTLRWYHPIGVPVVDGDVLGFYIGPGETPPQLLYSPREGSTERLSRVYYLENVDSPLCNMSLCDGRVKRLSNTAPYIVPTFRIPTAALIDTARQIIAYSRPHLSCATKSFSSCSAGQHTRHFRATGETSPVPSVPSLSSSSTTAPVNPTPSPTTGVPVPTPSVMSTTPLYPTATEDSVSTTDSLNMSRSPDGSEGSTGDMDLAVSAEAIAFIVIGILLLIILIVLVIVLIACLCTKSAKVEQSSSDSRRQLDVSSENGRMANGTQLEGSSSVDQSMLSNETCSVKVFSARNTPSRTGHHYTNGEVSHEGVFSSFSPAYYNTNKHPLAHSISHGHLRLLSTNVNHKEQVPIPSPLHHVRSRARSVEPSAKLCAITRPGVSPNKRYLDPQPPPLPARSTANGVKANVKQCPRHYSEIDVSADYDDPIPTSKRRVLSCSALVGLSVRGRNVGVAHDYADPDAPPAREREQHAKGRRFGYDKLIPRDESFDLNALDSDSLPPPFPQRHWTVNSFEDHSYSDPDVLPNNMDRRDSNCIYTYVPTEDQRRLLLSSGGHYEIEEDYEKPNLIYDHLKFFEERETYWAPANTESGLYTQLYENKYREIPRNQIRILRKIGAGHFGAVSMGVWVSGEDEQVEVAIKTVKTTSELERIKLLQEAAIMGQFAHVNVVRLLGVVTVGEPALVILEYMTRGDLRSFLQKLHPKNSKRELPDVLPSLFIKFGKDIANGMSYLSKKFFVHRDLAARNILLTHNLTCKIGDFGMARDIENNYYKSHGGIIPVKWTAPEALNYNKFSTTSDVWSFGMVLFEIWSLGEKPFNELTNPIVIALVSSKHCQPPPPGCPRAIYHLMVECWNPDASKRPTFDGIYNYFDSPIESLTYWQPSDKIAGKNAHILAAPLSEANNLYLHLQRTYQKPLLNLSQ